MDTKQSDIEKSQKLLVKRRIILEMIEASLRLAREKGPHPLTDGCNCIACVNHRKRILAGPPKPWRFRL